MTEREAEHAYRKGYRLIFDRANRERKNVDWKAAADHFEAAARAGHAEAAYRYARCYDTGNGRKPNIRHALTWYRRAAALYEPRAAFQLALAYRDGDGVDEDRDAAFAWLAFGARVGDADCASELGHAYHEGIGTPVDRASAVRWYTVAADAGITRATFNLALCYLHGDGVPTDPVRAHALLTEASGDGHAASTATLDLARERVAEAAGSGGAARDVGRELFASAFDAAVGGTRDAAVAARFKKAAELGSLDAAYALGNWYLHETGVRRDVAKAFAYFARAAVPSRARHTCAYWDVSLCYRNGEGAPAAPGKAFAYALRAALRGDRNAAYAVACAYFLGDGTPEDRASALAWFERVDELDAERATHGSDCETVDQCRACREEIEQSRRRIAAGSPE